jgi:hypothetical protein
MSGVEAFTHRDAEFSAVGKVDGDALVLELEGTADARAVDALGRVLRELHQHALATRARKVTIDFRETEFMNSSCFKAFVVWITQVQDEPPDRQYRMVFLSNPQFHWQRRSLHALSCFAADLIELDTDPKP